ncbi:MAG: DNA topoisomerase III [Cellulosilyticaceae bacterium]
MGKIVVLAEKPSVARDIAKVLKCTKKGNGYIEGNTYIITWGLGHLVTLATPEKYGDQYKQWSMETLPMLPVHLKTEVIGKTSKHFSDVKKVLTRKDIDELIIATDPAREGELVARWIIEKVGFNKPIKRLWISSQTDRAILDGFKNLQPSTKYDNLYKAALCRAEADWILGLNVTRALTCRYNAQLSAGRVQSATLAMIVNREEEIKNFKPKDYYTIMAETKGFTLIWQDKNNNSRIWNEQEANKLLANVTNGEAQVKEVNENYKKQYSPIFYDLTELQRDANRLFGYSAKETLSIMQRLYENHKVLTYPRTDSKHITTDIVPTLNERLRAVSVGEYRTIATEILKKPIKSDKRFVDNSKVSDHHGIIPTEERLNLANLSNDERKIYDLVIKRFFAVLLPPFEYLQTTVTCEIKNEIFIAKGKVVKDKGWKSIYSSFKEEDDDDEAQELPELKKGSTLTIKAVRAKKHQTQPPARFNEGTLLAAMEKPHKYLNIQSQYAKTLGETGGIGTVATRADIIEKLFNMYYVERSGKDLIPTSKGKQLMELVPEDLKSPVMTAKWESDFEMISKGKMNPKEFINDMKAYTKKLVNDVKNSQDKYVHDNMVGKRCPECNKNLLEVKGKFGKSYVCQDRECGYKEAVSKFTNTRCPQCHKKLELRGEGEGQIYACTTCAFREKVSSFNKKYRSDNKKVDKRSVQRYLKEQQKEDEGNFAFAAAFAKLKDTK